MDKNSADFAVINALIKRFSEQRLPRALNIQKKVFSGEVLSSNDLSFLDNVFHDAKYILQLTDKHPEYQEMAARGIDLYREITEKALENEKKKG